MNVIKIIKRVLTQVFCIKSGRRCAPSWGPPLTLRPLCPRSARARSPLRGSLACGRAPGRAAVGAPARPLGTTGGLERMEISGWTVGRGWLRGRSAADGGIIERKLPLKRRVKMIVSRRREEVMLLGVFRFSDREQFSEFPQSSPLFRLDDVFMDESRDGSETSPWAVLRTLLRREQADPLLEPLAE